MTIDKLTVVRIMSFGVKRGFVVVNTNGATSNQVLVYTVDIDSSGNITSNTFTLFMSYYLVGNSSELTGDIITSDNWSQYISTGGGSWNATTDNSYSDLYNAKELIIFMYSSEYGAIQQYYNFNYDTGGNGGCSLGANFTNYYFYLNRFGNQFNYFITWYYDGSYIHFQNSFDTTCQYVLLYKT